VKILMDALFSQGDKTVKLTASIKTTKKTKEKITVNIPGTSLTWCRSMSNEQMRKRRKNSLYISLDSRV